MNAGGSVSFAVLLRGRPFPRRRAVVAGQAGYPYATGRSRTVRIRVGWLAVVPERVVHAGWRAFKGRVVALASMSTAALSEPGPQGRGGAGAPHRGHSATFDIPAAPNVAQYAL